MCVNVNVCEYFAFNNKIMYVKYQPILAKLSDLGYQCKLVVLIFGSLGHVHNLVFSGFSVGWQGSPAENQNN